MRGMAERATAMGLVQKEEQRTLIWEKEGIEQPRWAFVDDPSPIEAVHGVFNSERNIRSPACFVVVTQKDPGEDRGDVVLDIFGLSPQSYLWHFYRVYTPPGTTGGQRAAPRGDPAIPH